MGYREIVEKIGNDLNASTAFAQREVISKWAREMRKGQCSGHAIDWLISRYKGEDYLEPYGKKVESSSLLAESKSASSAKAKQKTIDGNWDDVAKFELSKEKMTFKVGQSNLNSLLNINTGRNTIADLVLDGSCRYFILYINGTKGAHLTAIHRPWKLFGKSIRSFVFDPNYGQFECKTKFGLKRALRAIYQEYLDKVARDFVLLAFEGNGW